jgi:presequence protease
MNDSKAYATLQSWDLPDFHGTGTLYRHRKSGAQIFHLANDDRENFFAFAFATLPGDSTGVAHILEHTVLCGSRRFPVKDPFLQLLKGSVNTFLNAMTYPDKTVYPAASPVKQDLFNMMKVYGDAVFHPLLKRELFRQEGHRLQFNEQDMLEITGIVYNEMKGNYSSHDSIAGEKCSQSLFPDILYRHDSGGDPAAIPDLTWEQFIDFHRRYYHPSNARIILYGDIPAGEYLSFLDDEFLHEFDRGTTFSVLEEQPPWEAPRVFETTYPVEGRDDLTRRSSVTLNWMLFPVTETRRLLAASVMTEILLGHSGSPLTKALIDSGLGQDLSPVYGLEGDLREAIFSAGLRGTDPEQRQAIEGLIVETLQGLVDNGIDPEIVEGALRRIEFRQRELKSGPNGMRVMSRALRSWMYGGSPAAGLQFSEDMASLRTRLEQDPRLFETMIRDLLVNNRHRSTVIVRPDPDQTHREAAHQRAELDRLQKALSEEEQTRIIREKEALDALQAEDDDPRALAAIPFLTLEDIPREIHRIPFDTHRLTGTGTTVYLHRENTNGILYLDLAFDFGALSPREEALLNLLGQSFTEVGLPSLPYDRFNREVSLKTGGISTFIANQTHLRDLTRIRRLFVIRLKVLDRSWRDGMDLLRRLLEEIDFSDTTRLHQILEEMAQDMIGALIPSGHYFAGLRAAMGLSGLLALEEEMNGITQLGKLREFMQEDPVSLGGDLRRLAARVLDPDQVTINVTGDSQAVEDLVQWIPELLETARLRHAEVKEAGADTGSPAREVEPLQPVGVVIPPRLDGAVREYLLTSAGVAYVAAAIQGIPFGDPLAPAQDLLAHMLRTGLLWEKIRMRGGAYGAFAQSRTAEGIFNLASYRDPCSARTLVAYESALRELSQSPLPDSVLDQGKVSVLGRELRPLTPREAGFVNFRRRLIGVDDELRQTVRDELRAVDPAAVQQAATVLHDRFADARVAVLGGEEGLRELRDAVTGPGPGGELVVVELEV